MLTLCSDKIHQAGGVAAPIAGQVLSEVLPYLESVQDNLSEEDRTTTVTVPDVRNMTVEEAQKILKDAGLEMELNTQEEINKKETVITEQTPKPGLSIESGKKVYLDV